jgi:hypothetical protein
VHERLDRKQIRLDSE